MDTAPAAPRRRRTTNPLPVAVVLGGTYRYLEGADWLLGHGTFGSVYRGNNIETGAAVAVKKLDNRKIKVEELSVLKRLDSEYIVGLMEVLVPDTEPFTYFIMDLCDTDLSKYLRRADQANGLNKRNLGVVISDIARGYEVLYGMGIIHMDIKPQNILVCYVHPEAEHQCEIRTVKLSDFGSCRIANTSESRFTKLVGTPLYMAPEVAANVLEDSEYNHQVDMWSIGVVLYECVTGKAPFDERMLCKLILYAATGSFSCYAAPTLPQSAGDSSKTLIRSLLEIDPEKRLIPEEFVYQALNLVESEKSLAITNDSCLQSNDNTSQPNGINDCNSSIPVPKLSSSSRSGNHYGRPVFKRSISFDVNLVRNCEVKRHLDLLLESMQEEQSNPSSRDSSPSTSPSDTSVDLDDVSSANPDGRFYLGTDTQSKETVRDF